MAATYAYTCVTCNLAFDQASTQRAHYADDFHRFNAKRRAAALPAVTAQVFNEKVLSHRAATASSTSHERRRCDVCSKTFMSENAYADHLNSRKHKEAVGRPPRPPRSRDSTMQADESLPPPTVARLACLFCATLLDTFEAKMDHMLSEHGFFVPDVEYLVDLEGLVEHAAELVGTYNTCLYCGALFGTYIDERDGKFAEAKRARLGLDAVRKHMLDKSHCKLRWDTEEDRIEWSDFYDYSASYADHGGDDEGWEDTDDMVLDTEAKDAIPVDTDGRPVGLPPAKPSLRYGETEYELVLPSGARIGHRALLHIYKQNQVPYMNGTARETRAAQKLAHVDDRRLAASALVPVAGGTGHFGRGREVIQARSVGEAHHATKARREYSEIRAKEAQRTRVGIHVHNHQKHYRDPLLQ